MKKAIICLVLLVVGVCADAADEPRDVKYDELALAPEAYYNKDVVYEAVYLSSSATFPKYVEQSGLRANKYLWLTIGNMKVPAFARKTEEMTKFVAGLGKLTRLKVLGQVKKFKRAPDINMMPHYYVLIEDVEVIQAGPAKPAEGQNPDKPDRPEGPPPGHKPRLPRWRR